MFQVFPWRNKVHLKRRLVKETSQWLFLLGWPKLMWMVRLLRKVQAWRQSLILLLTETGQLWRLSTIILADGRGTEMKLPFRSNQTIRDIRNTIDQLYPYHDRGYYLQSMFFL